MWNLTLKNLTVRTQHIQDIQRPARVRKPLLTLTNNQTTKSKTVKDVLSSPNKVKWEESMKKEMESLYSYNVWSLVELLKIEKQWAVNGCSNSKLILMEHLRDTKHIWLQKVFHKSLEQTMTKHSVQ